MKVDKRRREQDKVADDRDDNDGSNRSVSGKPAEEGSDCVKRPRNAKKPRVTVTQNDNQSTTTTTTARRTVVAAATSNATRRRGALPTRANKKSATAAGTAAAASSNSSSSSPDGNTTTSRDKGQQLTTGMMSTAPEDALENREKLAATLLCNMAPASAPPTSSSSSREDKKAPALQQQGSSVDVPPPPPPPPPQEDEEEAANAVDTALQSREELAVSMLCSMAPKKDREELAATMLCRMAPTSSDDEEEKEKEEETAAVQAKSVTESESFRARLQTPEKMAVTMLYNMDGKPGDSNASKPTVMDKTTHEDVAQSDDDEDEQGKAKKKRRSRDLSKPTLDSLVQDRFGGDVFCFLECVEKEMNEHNFTATGLARKYGAVNCQSRFRTIVAELKEEPIVGMSRLWKERVQAYLRSKRGEDGQGLESVVDERLRLVKRYVKKNADTQDEKPPRQPKSDEKVAAVTALTTLGPADIEPKGGDDEQQQPQLRQPPPPPARKRHRPMLDEGAKTTLDVLVQEKFGGDTFHFLQSVEKEMNVEGFTATGLARKYGAVNCQSRFRTIVAELKGEPIVGMSRLWKERVQAYLRSKESNEEAQEKMAVDEVSPPQEETLRLVQDNSKWKRNSAGTVGMFVRQTYGSNFNRFLQNLEDEMKKPGFSAAGYARRHHITEGRKMLMNIVAELKGLPNTTLTQTWKDRVQAYLLSRTKGEKVAMAPSESTVLTGGKADGPDNTANASDDDAGPSAGAAKPMTLRFTEEGHPLGVLDTLVQAKFAGDVFAFLDHLEKEVQVPDFTAGTFAKKHGVTEGKRTLQRIVAQLKGESAHSSQMWKDRVQAYMQYKAGTAGAIYPAPSSVAPKVAAKEVMNSTMDDASNEDVVKENVTLHDEISGCVAV